MLALISAAIAPAFALLSFFYLKDEYELEPIIDIFRNFLYGFLLVFPLMFIQFAVMEEQLIEHEILQSYLLFGLLEEFFKWFLFLFVTFKNSKFLTAYDGIVYGVSISLGFATFENVLYLFAHGIEFAFSRAIFPVSAHALFGVIMGYYMGKASMRPEKKNFFIFLAFILPFLLHGTYDYILMAIGDWWIYGIVPFMIFLWVYSLRKVKVANEIRYRL